MQISLSPAPLGAEITGIDLSGPVDEDTLQRIVDLFHDRGVVVFRDQHLSEAQQIAFSSRFGRLEIHIATHCLLPGYPEILIVSNVMEDGRHIGLADAGQYWHSDLSYIANPSRCSLLYALEVPVEKGVALGETLFASAAYAFETLPDSHRRRLEGLTALHGYGDRYRKQQAAGGRSALTEEQLAKVPSVHHPVFRPHPITGRKVVFVNEGFTESIDGMPPEESTPLLAELFQHITRPESVYRHQWRVGDLVMWDNCLTQHRAVRNYQLPLRRRMHRTTVAGAV